MSYQETSEKAKPQSGRVSRLWHAILRVLKGMIHALHFGRKTPQYEPRISEATQTQKQPVEASAHLASEAQSDAAVLGSVQTMVATPETVAHHDESVAATNSFEQETSIQASAEAQTEPYSSSPTVQGSANLYIKPLPAPPLPKEHRAAVKKLVRGGSRRKAEEKLEELGYLFPEVSTRGSTVVVRYRGYNGYLYIAKFRYK
jgi:hypothetical protein